MQSYVGHLRTLSLYVFVSIGLLLPLAARSQTAQSPEEFMQGVVNNILGEVKTERQQLKQDPDKLRQLVINGIMPHVDFPYVSQLVLGQYWRTASPQQRDDFMAAFRDMLMRTYADALLSYEDQTIKYLPSHNDPKAPDANVNSQIIPKNGEPISVTYRLYRNKQNEWKVYDITVEGISLVTNYRNTFANEVRTGGLDNLIQKLKTHNIKAIDVNKKST
jgi:phospholipid transport system substrate-binding protein